MILIKTWYSIPFLLPAAYNFEISSFQELLSSRRAREENESERRVSGDGVTFINKQSNLPNSPVDQISDKTPSDKILS